MRTLINIEVVHFATRYIVQLEARDGVGDWKVMRGGHVMDPKRGQQFVLVRPSVQTWRNVMVKALAQLQTTLPHSLRGDVAKAWKKQETANAG